VPHGYATGVVARDQLRQVEPSATDFARLNGAAYAAETMAWIDQKRDEAGAPQEYMARRDAHIADHIAAVANRHPDARVAVVIGAMHKGDLERLLSERGVEVDSPQARSSQEVARSLEATDVLAIVSYCLDNSGAHATPEPRFRELCARITGDDVLSRYVRARIAMIDGEYDTAARAFAELAETGADVHFPYRGSEWRLHLTVAQASRLELGRIADLRGERASAEREYRALLASLPEPVFDEGYHADYEFVARAHNAARWLLQTPFRVENTFVAEPVVAAAAKAGGSLPKHLWQLHRGKHWEELAQAIAGLDRERLVAAELLEVDYHAAAISIATGRRAEAEQQLASLAERAAELSDAHWLVRSLPSLQQQLGGR
jgi:hypothetical protein